jgi:hypothetical protein
MASFVKVSDIHNNRGQADKGLGEQTIFLIFKIIRRHSFLRNVHFLEDMFSVWSRTKFYIKKSLRNLHNDIMKFISNLITVA